jgi:hypothetical protein
LLSAPPSVQFAGGGMVVIFAVVRFSGEVCGASDPFSIWFCSNCFDCLCSQLVWWWLRFDFVPVVLVFYGSRVVFLSSCAFLFHVRMVVCCGFGVAMVSFGGVVVVAGSSGGRRFF